MGSVEVVISPAEATLRIDGEDQPTAGAARQIALGPGPHRLEARLPGWSPAAQTVTITGGDALAIKLGLAPAGERVAGPDDDGAPGGARPRVRGPYGLLAFTTFVPLPPTDFTGTALGFAGGLRLGYRFASILGGELSLEYAHASADGQGKPSFADAPGGLPFSYGLSSFRAALGLRLMTTGQRVRFVQVFGGGMTYDAIHWTPGAGAGAVTRQDASGPRRLRDERDRARGRSLPGPPRAEPPADPRIAGRPPARPARPVLGRHLRRPAVRDRPGAPRRLSPLVSAGLGVFPSVLRARPAPARSRSSRPRRWTRR